MLTLTTKTASNCTGGLAKRQWTTTYHSVIILSLNLLERNANFLDLQNFLRVAVSSEEWRVEVAVNGYRQGTCAGPGGSTGIIVGLDQHLQTEQVLVQQKRCERKSDFHLWWGFFWLYSFKFHEIWNTF